MDEALTAYGASLRGPGRPARNAFAITEGVEGDVLMTLCDAEGGTEATSRTATQAIETSLALGTEAAQPRLNRAIAEASRLLRDVDGARGGESLVAAWVIDGIAYTSCSGKARVLLIRDEAVAARSGCDEPADRANGQSASKKPLGPSWPLRVGDCLVLCCDALLRVVAEGELCKIVARRVPEKSVGMLLRLASSRGIEGEQTLIVGLFRDPCMETLVDDALPDLGDGGDTDQGAPERDLAPAPDDEASQTIDRSVPSGPEGLLHSDGGRNPRPGIAAQPAPGAPTAWKPHEIALVVALMAGAMLAVIAVSAVAIVALS